VDEQLWQLIESRLESEGLAQKNWVGAVFAAGDGRPALEAFLECGKLPAKAAAASASAKRPGAFLTSLAVQGFRGIGPSQTLTVAPGPGLTLVVGRNGSGKSSFAEALEVLFTGDSKRWADRSKIWKEGWRNLHQPHPTTIHGDMLLEGQGALKVSATWDAGSSFESPDVIVQPKGKSKTSLAALGWNSALVSYRPFLSYNELGSMLDEGPSKLYDALSLVLGLEDLVQAQDALAKARTERQRAWKLVDEQREEIVEALKHFLEQDSDKRASLALDALTSKDWRLVELQGLLDSGQVSSDDREVTILKRALLLETPDPVRIKKAATALRAADAQLKKVEGTDADRARKLALLLEQALKFHETHAGTDCPVCGTKKAIGVTWAKQTRQEIDRLKASATESEAVHKAAEEARRQAIALIAAAPDALLTQLFDIGVDGLDIARAVWREWHAGTALIDLSGPADHIENKHETFTDAVDRLKKGVAARLKQIEDRWKPLAEAIATWLPEAEKAVRGMQDVPRIKAAEDWLRGAATDIRDDRFAPIADQAMATWQFLRQNSNVELGRIELAGARTSRHVTLDVTVDGVRGAALGVMSQGELHALALSLFLPRATLPESPFRFVVIDDPVQSMDPARVDGLARALEAVGKHRQVIVFTHDERLPDAVRRLDINATILSVTRRPKSVVEVRTALDPVRAHIEDALALVHTTELPKDVLQRLIPGFCRAALEASFTHVVRRRGLATGRSHADIEDDLKNAGKTTTLAALAFYADKDRGGDVMGRLNQFGKWAGDAFRACKDGAHQATGADLSLLIKDTEKLALRIIAEVK
jgi:ABC-type Mn2+/Zn2+ transport system ATPase subunit